MPTVVNGQHPPHKRPPPQVSGLSTTMTIITNQTGAQTQSMAATSTTPTPHSCHPAPSSPIQPHFYTSTPIHLHIDPHPHMYMPIGTHPTPWSPSMPIDGHCHPHAAHTSPTHVQHPSLTCPHPSSICLRPHPHPQCIHAHPQAHLNPSEPI